MRSRVAVEGPGYPEYCSASVVILLATAELAFPQTTNTGVIIGVVVDQQGLFLPGATVELLSEATGKTRPITTESNGSFTFSAVEPGTYNLKITMSGFRSVERKGIQLRSRETLKLVFCLFGRFRQCSSLNLVVEPLKELQ